MNKQKLEQLMIKHKVLKEFDDGWDSLLLEFLLEFDRFYEMGKEEGLELYIIQTKEKYAGLRLHWSWDVEDGKEEKAMTIIEKVNNKLNKKTNELEKISFDICEHCGIAEGVYVNSDKNWMKSYCPQCHEFRTEIEMLRGRK